MSYIPLLGKTISSSKNILLINHVGMDPDAFGSLSALFQILNKLGKNVLAINDFVPPEDFLFLGHNHIISTDFDPDIFLPDVIISLDASSLDQLGNIYLSHKSIFQTTDFFVIDHHISNPGFGQYNIIKTDYSSTCEILYEIIEELGWEKYMDSSTASCLFSGIITDTNIFYNKNTTTNTHRIAGELMKHGADFRAPIFEFYKKKDFNASKLWGEILKDLTQITLSGTVITYALVKDESFIKTQTNASHISGLINEFLANIDGSDVCFLLYPIGDGLIKASMRSQEIDVSRVCQKFGGGGHVLAGGFSSPKDIHTIKNNILEALSL